MPATQEQTGPMLPMAEALAPLLTEVLAMVERRPPEAWAMAQQALQQADEFGEALPMAWSLHAARSSNGAGLSSNCQVLRRARLSQIAATRALSASAITSTSFTSVYLIDRMVAHSIMPQQHVLFELTAG